MPQTYRVLLAKRAATDLEEIFDRIAKDSPGNAARVIDRILTAIDGLKTFPHRNLVAEQDPTAAHPLRSMPVQSWIVFFRVLDQHHVVRVLRVRHGARRRLKRYE